ncbi:HAMP domain-containing sensor histidine kinase [Gordonibacter pamelaeae]|uniref:HAMP domain-containing sensor histidine kinase n=1 Tax=Gordonibacter pamelaeae TaxID=471189 RepID=UPI002FE0CFBC
MQDSATTGPIGKAGADDAGAGKRKRPGWDNLSYTTRVTAAFAFIAAMTALVAIGVVSFVWEQHFQTYTRENMVSTAESVAKDIAANYEKSGTFDAQTLAPARYMVNVTPSIGMRVVDNTVPANTDQSVVFDSTLVENGEDAAGGVSLVPKHAKPEQMVTVPIEVKSPDNEMTQAVGSVSVWVLGSDTLLRSTDEEFRNKSYQAMFFAAAMAILLASCIGFLFARNLVGPINRMTKTAKAIKEGDLSARTDLHGEDEIARLGETFDEMADSVEKDRELERRLTTDVAHELRTPLMAIQSTVEAMVDGVFEADPEHLETVNSEVQRLSRLVDSLLKLSRLENRANPMKEEVVDVGQLISGIIATHDAFVTDSGLTLEYQADEGVRVLGDADMIRQATANLISNAVRYTPEGGHITVQVKRGDLMASIAVRDTGIGLTPEECKMVFSRFWRADAGRNRESGGLGIGLAVVKEIVDRHGGWVQVEGRKDEGACFTIRIPLYDEGRTPKARQQKPKQTKVPKAAKGKEKQRPKGHR